jgi:hypothetical protein
MTRATRRLLAALPHLQVDRGQEQQHDRSTGMRGTFPQLLFLGDDSSSKELQRLHQRAVRVPSL